MRDTKQGALPERVDYGGSAELTALLDGVAVILREEDQHNWESWDLRDATEALRDHLTWRLR